MMSSSPCSMVQGACATTATAGARRRRRRLLDRGATTGRTQAVAVARVALRLTISVSHMPAASWPGTAQISRY